MCAPSDLPPLGGITDGLVVVEGFPLPIVVTKGVPAIAGHATKTGTCPCKGAIWTAVIPIVHPQDGPRPPFVRTYCIKCGTNFPTPEASLAEKVAA